MNLYSLSIVFLLSPLFIGSFFAVKYARSGGTRLTISVFFLITVGLAFLVPIEFSSHAKPISMEWYKRDLSQANLIWGGMKENVGIFVLLDWGEGPRLYRIPWDIELALELQQAMEEAEENDGEDSESQEGQDGQEGQEGEKGEEESDGGGSAETAEGEQTTSFKGNSGIVVRYPFLTKEERAERLEQEGQEGDEGEGLEEFDSRAGRFEKSETESPKMFYALPQQTDPPKEG